jgi:hypothetical protein
VAGESFLEATTGVGFNLEGGTTDIFAGVLFKLGVASPTYFGSGAIETLFTNFDLVGMPPSSLGGWFVGLGRNAFDDVIQLVGFFGDGGGTPPGLQWPITLPKKIVAPVDPRGTGPTLNPSADRLIFGVLHIRPRVPPAETLLGLWINGALVASVSVAAEYVPSTVAPTVGFSPAIAALIAPAIGGQSLAEIAGVCFSHMTIPEATLGVDVAALMLEAWRTTRAACAIGSLTADNRLDWDHRWNASAVPTPPIVGPNGFPYVPFDPAVVGPITDIGNEGGFAAPGAGVPVDLTVVGTDLTVVTTLWPDWFSWQLPWDAPPWTAA